MNVDKARKTVEEKLSQKGYVHPTEMNHSSQNTQYMVYKEKSKNEDVYVSESYNPYATFNSEHSNYKEKPKTMYCPLCTGKAMYECNCTYGDVMCSKGHVWYVMDNGKVMVEDPHEK